MAGGETGRHIRSVGVAVLTDALAERLERREAGASPGGVAADALSGAVIDGDEPGGGTLVGPAGGGVAAPPGIGAVRAERAVVGGRSMPSAGPCRGQESRLAQQAQDAWLAGPDAGQAQPRPDLTLALADERRRRQDATDLLGQLGSRPRGLRPTLPSHRRRRAPGPRGVDGRARKLQHPTHPSQAVATIHGGRDGLARHRDLRRPKGTSPSARRARSKSSSSPASARRSSPAVDPPRRHARRPVGSSRRSRHRSGTGPASARSSRPLPQAHDSRRRGPHHAALAARPPSSAARTTVPAHYSPSAPRSRTFPPRGIMPQMGVQGNPGAEDQKQNTHDAR